MRGTYHVMWFYFGNFKSNGDGVPSPAKVEADHLIDAINKGVFYVADKFRKTANFLIVRPDGSVWTGNFAQAASDTLTEVSDLGLDEQAVLNSYVTKYRKEEK